MDGFKDIKFDADLDKVLQLVSRSLYTNKDIFLRELISNASDACDKLRYGLLTHSVECDSSDELKICITFDEAQKQLIIYDNGIGMNEQDLIENLGTIARSGTQKFVEAVKAAGTAQAVELIGCFGVGFYSSFMVADEVEVYTCKAGEEKGWIWKSKGDSKFSIGESSEPIPRGTKIILRMNEEGESYLNRYKIEHIINTYSKHISFPIELTDEAGKLHRLNGKPAIWTRSSSDISEDEYTEFFRSISHVHGKPWMVIHNKNEGMVDYTNLLFIPQNRPFDLFHQDGRTSVKLFCNRVFITDDNAIMTPTYLRFVHGVVDSPDLPLNISRETLQNSRAAGIIKKSVTSRVLSELKKRAMEDKEGYKDFWNNFGAVLKEGLCDPMPTDQRENLMAVCRFYSSMYEDNTLTGMDEYIERMNPKQEFIYYLTGQNIDSLRKSPQLEGFLQRGIEVLLLADGVDGFWTTVVTEYNDKKLKSAMRSDIDLTEFELKDDKTDNKSSGESDSLNENTDKLLSYFKDILGDEVGSVRISKKLISSPVCLVVNEGAMDIRMERFLRDQKQLNYKTPKVLEVNTGHKLIKKIAGEISANPDDSFTADIVRLLFDQACVLEGEEVQSPDAFASRINTVIERLIL